jgi:hypothetical protein
MSKIGDVVIEREQDFYTMTSDNFQKKYGDEIWLQVVDSYLDDLYQANVEKLTKLEELGV